MQPKKLLEQLFQNKVLVVVPNGQRKVVEERISWFLGPEPPGSSKQVAVETLLHSAGCFQDGRLQDFGIWCAASTIKKWGWSNH